MFLFHYSILISINFIMIIFIDFSYIVVIVNHQRITIFILNLILNFELLSMLLLISFQEKKFYFLNFFLLYWITNVIILNLIIHLANSIIIAIEKIYFELIAKINFDIVIFNFIIKVNFDQKLL